jgi:hypothetical protein
MDADDCSCVGKEQAGEIIVFGMRGHYQHDLSDD